MSPTPPDPETMFDQVDESCRAEFERAWLSGQRMRIAECLPVPGSDQYLPTLEELICIQMQFQWKQTSKVKDLSTAVGNADTLMTLPTKVEAYVREFPQIGGTDLQQRLIRQEFLIRRRQGDQPNVSDYRNRFPDIDIESLLASDGLNSADGYYESSAGDESSAELMPTIEGYELIERLGAGGMGVVYRARQIAADRVVALKLIRAERLQQVPEQTRQGILDRFRVEAQATARLDHPNVVGVFDVNVSDPAMPWFSMQLVEGQSLSEHLRSGPVDGQSAAGFTLQITKAITAAHGHGILHRDLKPQNVFLRDNEQHLLVGDFGLAKFEVDDTQRTRQDDLLGTPAYMSPEQIRDPSSVTEATDIWSIGATLYHLLTGRPPFQAASAMETLRQVLDYEPTSPRALNPAVDRDLETICLKCLQKDVQKRYRSASALAEDLTLYLAGKPITARPVSRVERIYRWCRRNPLDASLAASAIAAGLVAIVSLAVGYTTAASALRESDKSHQLARQTVHDLLTEVSETVLLEKPGMQPLRRRLHERALDYYRRFAAAGRDNPELRAVLGDTWYRIGRIEKILGHSHEAASAFRQALLYQRPLAASAPTVDSLSSLSSTWNAMGTLEISNREWNEAADFLMRAHALRSDLVENDPANSELKRLHASTIMNLGAVHRNRREFADALDKFLQASEIHRGLLSNGDLDDAGRRHVQRDLGMALYNTANTILDRKAPYEVNEVLNPLSEAVSIFRGLLDEQPESYTFRRRLVLCQQLQAEADPNAESAAQSGLDAAEQMLRLINENPDVPSLIDEWVQLQLLSGRLFTRGERHEEAMFCFETIVDALNQLKSSADAAPSSDIAVAVAEAALAASRVPTTDAQEKLAASQVQLEQFQAQSAGNGELMRLLVLVNEALRAPDN